MPGIYPQPDSPWWHQLNGSHQFHFQLMPSVWVCVHTSAWLMQAIYKLSVIFPQIRGSLSPTSKYIFVKGHMSHESSLSILGFKHWGKCEKMLHFLLLFSVLHPGPGEGRVAVSRKHSTVNEWQGHDRDAFPAAWGGRAHTLTLFSLGVVVMAIPQDLVNEPETAQI